MAIPRVSANLGRTVFRRAATQSRTQAWRQAARRHASTGTASAEKAKKTSDIPWMIGSVAFTVPAAVWLLGQGPQKSDHHGAGHEDEHKEEQTEGQKEEAPAEEGTEDKAEGESDEKSDDKSEEKPKKSDEKTEKSEEKSDKSEDKSEGESEEKTEDKSKDKKDSKSEDKQDSKSEDKKDPKSDDDSGKAEEKDSKEDGDDQKSEGSSDEGSEGGDGKETPDSSGDDDEYEKPGPNAPGQINYKSSMARGPGENQKGGARPKSETSGEKNSAKDKSGAKHPYLDDDEKSKKGEGLKETQRIHGTVASDRPLR